MDENMNEFNQPVGKPLPNWKESASPTEMKYIGRYTIVTRLSPAYTNELYDAFSQSHPSHWTYLSEERPNHFSDFERLMEKKIASNTHIYYVVINKLTEKPVGIFSLLRIDPRNGVIEVGNIHFSDSLKKTTMATEAHALLAEYIFEELGYRRYEWKCDSLNAPSIHSAKRLGFTYEGTFRNAVIYKNRSRDTSWFSMLLEEWPDRKQAFHRWLSPANFDDKGEQIERLETYQY
ncbi:GNAT family acetyltransferase [Geomicrobium sp. JCM 19037]|uniref:GNAT family N-acetyltransferase n=1 Tax=Geomicrobium sp. JCM 19037 TaxID=1460634 RepID=UPI00045F2A70|nr:GNAT family protein [Geomicrobium sp. JCM 19037]GAK04315.1 GNAT family acetyltransferase [Geomicrobium sp. JCM 19037]